MTSTRTETYSVTVERDADTGELVSEIWENPKTGEAHRIDGPAITRLYVHPNGRACRSVEYFQYGEKHRDGDEPADIVTDLATGIEAWKVWFVEGKLSRLGDQPAYLRTDPETGVVVVEEYRIGGNFHRLTGPARITRDRETGQITSKATWHFGVEIVDGRGTDAAPSP